MSGLIYHQIRTRFLEEKRLIFQEGISPEVNSKGFEHFIEQLDQQYPPREVANAVAMFVSDLKWLGFYEAITSAGFAERLIARIVERILGSTRVERLQFLQKSIFDAQGGAEDT